MNIIWKDNPLETVIILDEAEKELLKLKLKIEAYEETLSLISDYLEPGQSFDTDLARNACDESIIEKVDLRANEMIHYFIDELQSTHAGDCIAFPCSCSKCHAEYMLGINTIDGINKTQGTELFHYFNENKDATIDQCIEYFSNYEPVKGESWKNYSQEEFDKHVPGWKKQAANLLQWLIKYKAERLIK